MPSGFAAAVVRRHGQLEEYALQAFVFLVVYLIGTGVLIAFYYNLCVLDAYIRALFWAAIWSIPVFQIKLRLIQLLFQLLNWWWSTDYQVISISEGGDLTLRLHTKDDPEVTSSDHVMALPPEVMAVSDLQQRLKDGEELRARVNCEQPAAVVSIFRSGHWMGTLRPYESLIDLLRDFDVFCELVALLAAWMVRPFKSFADVEAGSQPYFGLVFRLCLLHVLINFLGPPFVVISTRLAIILVIFLMALRLVFTLLAHLAPRMVPLLIDMASRSRVPRELQDLVFEGVGKLKVSFYFSMQSMRQLSKWLVKLCLAALADNCHIILSLVIIFVCMIVVGMALNLLYVSFRREAILISRILHDLLRPTPAYQVFTAKAEPILQMVSAANSSAGIWDVGQYLIATTEYQEWLQNNVPDFLLMKYVLFDIWRSEDDNASPQAQAAQAGGLDDVQYITLQSTARYGEPPVGPGRSPGVGAHLRCGPGAGYHCDSAPETGNEEEELCQLAAAVGASCSTGPSQRADRLSELPEQLQNTAALLRLLADGNFSAAVGLARVAFDEIAVASSLLGGSGDGGGEERSTATMLDGALQHSTWVGRLMMYFFVVFHRLLTFASMMLGQAVVFLTALFYLLASRISCLEVVGEFLSVIDRSKTIFRISELVVRAVLLSALKMSAFHAMFTWLLYSWSGVPIVVVPTVLSALVALLPVVSPVWSISIWAAVYLWWQDQLALAMLALALNVAVWWQVPSVIYAEIPESNPWLTGLSVVLGIGQFGVAGVVVGPMIASVPLICFNLVKHFNEKGAGAQPSPRTSSTSILDLYRSKSFQEFQEDSEESPKQRRRRSRNETPMERSPYRPRQPHAVSPGALGPEDEMSPEGTWREQRFEGSLSCSLKSAEQWCSRDLHEDVGHEGSDERSPAVPSLSDLIEQKKLRGVQDWVLGSRAEPCWKRLLSGSRESSPTSSSRPPAGSPRQQEEDTRRRTEAQAQSPAADVAVPPEPQSLRPGEQPPEQASQPATKQPLAEAKALSKRAAKRAAAQAARSGAIPAAEGRAAR